MGFRTVNKSEINGLLGKKMIHVGDENNLVGAFYLNPYHNNVEFLDYLNLEAELIKEPDDFVIVVSGMCIFKRLHIVLNMIDKLVKNNDVETLFYFDDKIHLKDGINNGN